MPLYKVTLEGSLHETFYIYAKAEDIARGIAYEVVLDDPLIYFMPFEEVEKIDKKEDTHRDRC